MMQSSKFLINVEDTFGGKNYRLSSSVIELVYSLGSGKKTILLCEHTQAKKLQPNLMKLWESNIFQGNISSTRDTKDFFSNPQEVNDIKKKLKKPDLLSAIHLKVKGNAI